MPHNSSKNIQASSKEMVEKSPSEYFKYEDDSIDLLQLILNIKKRWKSIFLITFIGAILAITIALYIPKVYQSSTQLSLPKLSSVEIIKTNGINDYNQLQLFKSYYKKIRSEKFLKWFIVEHNYIEKLNSEEDDISRLNEYFSIFVKNVNIEVNEPKVKKGEFIENPSQITLSMQHTNEALLVEILNIYLNIANEELIKDFNIEETQERNSKLEDIKNKINTLKMNAKTMRELLISKLEINNQQKIDILQQNKQLLITKTKEDRNTQIATIEESNHQKTNELEQKKNLLISKAAVDRKNNIVKTQEAMVIAESLNIILPTKIYELDSNSTAKVEGGTNINLSNEQTLPLYLMGTKYLSTLIKTLKARKSDVAFLSEISQINSDIEAVKQDQKLKTLKNRKSDAPFIAELNNINKNIQAVKNDKNLKALKERQSDDPFIEELPALLNQAEQLKLKTLNFTNVKFFTLDRAAMVTKKAIKPNRPLIAILGTFLSVFIALIWALFSSALENRLCNSANLIKGL